MDATGVFSFPGCYHGGLITQKKERSFALITPTVTVAALLDELGLAIGSHQVEIVDFHQAESCYVHHTRVPVAVVGYALVSPAFAQGRFPTFSFLDLIAKRPSMDEGEACAVATICGAEAEPPFWGNPGPFGKQLWTIIDRYDLHEFFDRLDPKHAYGTGGDHYLMRPRGSDCQKDDAENEAILKEWRSNYKQLPEFKQLLVATIIRLYNSDEKRWLVRVPKKWHAAEAISILKKQGQSVLPDWARLYALYPGW